MDRTELEMFWITFTYRKNLWIKDFEVFDVFGCLYNSNFSCDLKCFEYENGIPITYFSFRFRSGLQLRGRSEWKQKCSLNINKPSCIWIDIDQRYLYVSRVPRRVVASTSADLVSGLHSRTRAWSAIVTAECQCCQSHATRPARPATAVDNLGQSPLPVKRLHDALQSAQVKRQRLSPPYPPPHPIHQLAVHQHIKVQQSIVQQSIVQQHQLNLAHQSLQNLQAAQSLQAQQNLQSLQAHSPASTGQPPATQGTLVPPQQPSPRAASPHHKSMELALCQSMDSVNTATTEEEVSLCNQH